MDLQENQIEKLEQYLNNTMEATEREAFQLEIDASPELQEFLDIFRKVNAMEDDASWPKFDKIPSRIKDVLSIINQKQTKHFSEKIKQQREKMTLSSKEPKRSFFKKIAVASVAAALTAVLLYQVVPNNADLDSLYTTYSTWEELPSVLEKGDVSNSQKLAMENAFKKGQFEKTVELSNQIINTSQEVQTRILLYKGAALLELNNFKEALDTFNLLLENDRIDSHKAYWYKAMVHLKKKDKAKTIVALKEVMMDSNNYKFKEAQELLKIIE